jgi:flagellar biosynthesis/type III secretory pathway chaperone
LQSLEKKSLVLDKIMEANDEHAAIAAAKDFDPEAFDVIFDKKDELIKELELLDRGFSTVYTRVKEELIGNKEAYKEEIAKMQALITEITDKSMNIQATEKRNKEALMSRMDMVKREIYQAKNTKKIASNYYKSMNGLNYVEPQFMDRKK